MALPVCTSQYKVRGARFTRWLTRMCVGSPLVNLELHGIDVLDHADGLASSGERLLALRLR